MSARAILVLAVLVAVGAPATASAATWQPEPATYGIGSTLDVPVPMKDGTVLSADVYYPADADGHPATGPFPVVMVQTPYGKDTAGYASGREGGGEASTEIGEVPYLIRRGYIDVTVDVRGTGASGGSFDILDPQQGADGAELVHWAASLPRSSGKVGLYGPSYMGIDQFMTAHALAAEGADSPLKAMFPIVAGNDVYRDLAFMGGMPGAEFDLAFVGLMTAVEAGNPPATHYDDPQSLAGTEVDHAGGIQRFQTGLTADIETGGPRASDEDYWQARAPRGMLTDVVRLGVPAFMVGGWFDVFQRGEPLNYSGLQNAWSGRSVAAAMGAEQRATGRYQLLQGPWYHLDGGTGIDIYRLQLAWYDHWLKGIDTGIERTDSPLHVYLLGANRWVDAARYPFSEATPRSLYLDAVGKLSDSAPTARTGADQLVYTGAGSPCGRQSDQYGAGAAALAFETAQSTNPCDQNDASQQAGPGTLTYTTDPLKADSVVAGPIAATLYATSTAAETFFEATLEDVAPDGNSTPLSTGALVGSQRAVDESASWRGSDGRLILPYHPYTRAAAAPVPTGAVTRYDIEISPTTARVPAGDRLRVTVSTSDFLHLLPTVPQAQGLAGGVYQLQRNAAAASFLQLPLAAADAFAPCAICR
jgi:putative CocE/NonD family hydrolase